MKLYLIAYESDMCDRGFFGGYEPEIFTSIKRANKRCDELNKLGFDVTYYVVDRETK